MAKKSYWEQLKDPRWQKMRLEILDREEFTCQDCGEKDKTLHVHHTYYEKGKAPWEYSPSSLLVLCEDCHGYMHQTKELMDQALRRVGGRVALLQRITGYINAIVAQADADEGPLFDVIDINDIEECDGIADALRVKSQDVEFAADKTDPKLWKISVNHFRNQKQ